MSSKIELKIAEALKNKQVQENLPRALGHSRRARASSIENVENWEELRDHASRVKKNALSRLDHYLVQLEQSLQRAGAKVIWARDSSEAVNFIVQLLHERGATRVVKSKSMTTEEVNLNEELEKAHVTPVETDLGEYIVQLAGQKPFHLLAPALNFSAREVAQLFEQKIGMPYTEDEKELTAMARKKLRWEFLNAGVGITGVNFAVAETGTLVIVENEGNALLSTAGPPVHIALMGIEKVIPRLSDLPIFLKLLTRSATGQPISSYVHFINGSRCPDEPDGPEQLYVILLDNGRSGILEDPYLSQTLNCIRCGACLNACPVYETIGGHAYGSTYQGPIGAILTPQLHSYKTALKHPFASSLCGACGDVCPVKIEIPHILLKLRERIQNVHDATASRLPLERYGFRLWAWSMTRSKRFETLSRWARRLQGVLFSGPALKLPFSPLRNWSRSRELPRFSQESFRELYRKRRDRESI